MEWLVQRFPQGRMPAAGDREALNKVLTNEDRRRLWRGSPAGVAYLKSLPAERMYDIVFALPQAIRTKLYDAADPQFRQRLQQIGGPGQIVIQQLFDQKLIRSITANASFRKCSTTSGSTTSTSFAKGSSDFYLTARTSAATAIRPYVSALSRACSWLRSQSPAMLFYLDNWQSVARQFQPPFRGACKARDERHGLNENYGRELLEFRTWSERGVHPAGCDRRGPVLHRMDDPASVTR